MFEGLGAYGFFYYCLLTRRRKESSGLGKKAPTDNKQKRCSFSTASVLQDPQPLPFSHLCVPKIIMNKSLWLLGT